jgi:hypothetical protein
VAVDAATNHGVCTTPTPTPTKDAAVAPTLDANLTEDAAADASEDSSTGVVILDDAGGNVCGVPLNDAGVPAPGGCSTSSVLVSGGGSSNLIATTDEAGQTVYEESGTAITEEGGVAVSGGNMVMGLQYGQPIQAMYQCGYGSASSTSINVTGLKDGYYYNVAVACVDGNGNVGPLSNVSCGEPVPVADFWRLYYDAGGKAGGGFCSAEGVGVPAGTSGLGVLMVASMVAMIRRRVSRGERS